MIDEIERKWAQTRDQLSHQLKDARLLLEEQQQRNERTSATSLDDESVIVELRGRLSKQESLIEHFEKKEKKDTETLIQLTSQNENHKELLATLQRNVVEMQSKLNFERAEKESLQHRLQEAVDRVKEAETEISTAHVRLLHSSLILDVYVSVISLSREHIIGTHVVNL
jgi:chromosome segregation ATPase